MHSELERVSPKPVSSESSFHSSNAAFLASPALPKTAPAQTQWRAPLVLLLSKLSLHKQQRHALRNCTGSAATAGRRTIERRCEVLFDFIFHLMRSSFRRGVLYFIVRPNALSHYQVFFRLVAGTTSNQDVLLFTLGFGLLVLFYNKIQLT